MARDYSWARQVVGKRNFTIGELAGLLGVGRHAARRRLLKSGLQCKLITRRWRHPVHRSCWYVRRTWQIPIDTAKVLLDQDTERVWRQTVREYKLRVPMKIPW